MLHNEKFPKTNNPEAHLIFISENSNLFNQTTVLGYKKVMLAYSTYPKNLLRKDLINNKQLLIDTLNRI